jgi:hypothetical protein
MRHATRPGIIDGWGAVGVRYAIGLVHANNSERLSAVLHARPAAGVSTLAHINTSSGSDTSNSQSSSEKGQVGQHI